MHLDIYPPTMRLSGLPSGLTGAKLTLDVMRAYVHQYKADPAVRTAALELVRSLAQKDHLGEVVALHAFVRDHIRYVRDTRGVETVQTPPATLEIGQGDCDDKSTLLAALLESISFPTRFLAVGFAPKSLSHVLVETRVDNRWIALESTEPVPPGWKPRNPVFSMLVYN